MKRIILYALILVPALLVPVQKADVAQLRPIQVIHIYKEGGTVVLQTDTEDFGTGASAMEALENMKQLSPAVIYLDTAEYLLIDTNAQEEAVSLKAVLKKTVKVCGAAPGADLKAVAQYLTVHGKLPRLSQWKPGETLPELTLEKMK